MTITGSWSTIEVEVDGAVAHLRLNRPEHNNAVTTTMVVEVHEALEQLSQEPAVAVVALTGNGRSFCPGADLRGGGSSARREPPALPELVTYHSARLLHEMPQITVALVNGGCAGAGMAWASACDLRVASSAARFSTAFLEVGLAGELGLAWTLQRSLGGALARDLMLLPRKLTADELHVMGFVQRVFPAETFREDAAALVASLAARGERALRAMKANFVDAGRLPLGDYLDLESARHQAFFTDGPPPRRP